MKQLFTFFKGAVPLISKAKFRIGVVSSLVKQLIDQLIWRYKKGTVVLQLHRICVFWDKM
jgi:hypothetical protein